MIIGINLCEAGKGSINGCPYNNSKHQPLDISIELNSMEVMFISLCVCENKWLKKIQWTQILLSHEEIKILSGA